MESANSGHYGFLALNTCLLGGIIAYGKGLFLELLVCCSALGFFLSSLSLGCACSLPWNDNVKVMFSSKAPRKRVFFSFKALVLLCCFYLSNVQFVCVCKELFLGEIMGFLPKECELWANSVIIYRHNLNK